MAPMTRRALCAVLLAFAAFPARASEDAEDGSSVAAGNGVVVHNVDTKLLAARLRETDRKVLAGDVKGAAADLAEVLTGDVSPLVEEGPDSYLVALEAALQRVAALPPEGLAAFRETVDPHAAALLAEASSRADAASLAHRAVAMSLSTHGPRMLVALADMRASRGQVRLAARALWDLLRLWPEGGATAQMPGLDRAAVVARFATLAASLGDEAGVRWVMREASAALLDSPSPMTPGAKLKDDLGRCAAAAARRTPTAKQPLARPVTVAAERVFGRERRFSGDPNRSREISEHPLVIGTDAAPALLTREPSGATPSGKVVALAPGAAGDLAVLWSWPSKEEFETGLRRGGRGTFAPARRGDLVLFSWPMAPKEVPQPGAAYRSTDDDHNTLVALSLSAEGRLVDERGAYEEGRDDADRALESMSFCGRPLIVDDAVFATLIRRAEDGATELHVARFDLVPDGAGARLVLRWRRHVLDGHAMPPVRYPADESSPDRAEEALGTPAAMAERWGRIYVSSNTGAVACLDAGDGGTAWVHAYGRFGPTHRPTVVPALQKTWKDVPVAVDGPYVWAAPRDADTLLQFRDMPRRARTTLVQTWRFQGGAGTATEQGPLLANLDPDEVVAIESGVGWFSGSVPAAIAPDLAPHGSPLASLRLRDAAAGESRRTYAYAEIGENAACGSPCIVPGAIFFPTRKAIYRVALDGFEAAPAVLWRPAPVPRGTVDPDQIGNLVADGDRIWSVTPRRAVLFAPAK
jgi:hypothetical protein